MAKQATTKKQLKRGFWQEICYLKGEVFLLAFGRWINGRRVSTSKSEKSENDKFMDFDSGFGFSGSYLWLSN